MPVPPDLLARFGEPEHTFGPNTRFRLASTVAGSGLVLLAAVSFACGLEFWQPGPMPAGSRGVLTLLAAGLFAVGGAAIYLPWSLPPTSVFICPRGILRHGHEWEALAWTGVVRFEEMNVPGRAITIRQSRLVTAAGDEWGFIENVVTDYDSLVTTLRQKVCPASRPAAIV